MLTMPDHRLKNNVIAGMLFSAFLVFSQVSLPAPVLPPLNELKSGEQLTGKFVWFDLATTELEKQQAFYGAVFGWKFRALESAEDQYTLILNNDRNVAGMFLAKPREDIPAGALWIGLMSINDPVKAVSAVEQGGGVVHTQLMTVAQRGTYALFRDPDGALFGVLKSDSGDPPDHASAIGDFLWVDLFVDQPGKAAGFYQQLAGYELTKKEEKPGIERIILSSQGHSRAGVVPLPKAVKRAGWLPYVRVDDVDATLTKVTQAGGYIVAPPAEDLLDGNLAIISDPQGGVLGIVKWDESVTHRE
jgi:hypothetical protein